MNELDLFAAAIAIADPTERGALLDRECAYRPEIRQRLNKLLEAHIHSHPMLDRPNGPKPQRTGAYEPPASLVGTVIAGRYKLLEEIGDGGMGTVWMAEQKEPVKRLVAIKLIKAGMDSKAVLARFEAERQALALMDHPNIAKVHDAGTDDAGRPYFVMELVKGLPLTEYCDARKLSVNERLNLFVQICSAVQHAHQKAIIHRDLKPTNVLVTEHDGNPVPKVIDFGLAKALNSSQMLTERTLHTAYGAVVGTPLYMAPEQVGINALDVDTRTDIYALGVILYELLTGTTPLEKAKFKEAAWEEMKRLIREEEPPRPSTRLSSADTLPSLAASRQIEPAQLSRLVRGELDWIVMKALEKDRTRRYETANGLAKDVQRYLKGDAVEACPPTLGYRLRKVYQKNRTAIRVASAFALLLAVGVFVSAALAVRATNAERIAAADRDVALNAEKVATEKSEEATAAFGNLQVALNVQKNNQYAWDMQLISTAWETGQIEKIQQMLDRHPPDLRHFEWNYWNRRLHGERRMVSFGGQLARNERPDSITSWLLSESGTRAVTLRNVFDSDGPMESKAFEFHAKFYDTLENKPLGYRKLAARSSFVGFAFQTPCLSFDGNRLAIGFPGNPANPSVLKEIVVVDLALDKPIFQRSVESESVKELDLTPDGKYLLLECLDPVKAGTRRGIHLRVWDLNADKELWRTPIVPSRRMSLGSGRSLYLSRDGSRLAMLKRESDTDTRGNMTIWETATGKELMSLPNPAKGRQCLVLSPDGRRLAVTSSLNSSIRPGREGQPLPETEVQLRVLDVASRKELLSQTLPLRVPNQEAPAVQFNQDASLVFLAVKSRFRNISNLLAWNLDTGKALPDLNCRLSNETIFFSPNGDRFAVLDGNTLFIHNVNTGLLFDTLRGHVGAISEFAWSADGKRMYSIDFKGEFREWNVPSKSRTALRGVTVGPEIFNPMSPDGRFIVGFPGKENGRVSETSQPTLWEVENGQPRLLTPRPVPAQAKPFANYFAYSSNSRLLSLVRTTYDPLLRGRKADPEKRTDFADLTVWDVDTLKEVGFLSLPEGAVAAEISADARLAVIMTNAKGLVGVELPGGKQLWSRPDRGPALPINGIVRVSPDGHKIFCSQGGVPQPGGSSSRINYWVLDAKTGRDVLAFDFDDRSLRHCAWSPDSQRIAFGNSTQSRLNPKSDVVVRIHDVSTGELIVQVLGDTLSTPRATQSNSVAFSPDGRRIAVKTVDPQKPVEESSRIELFDSATGIRFLSVTTGFTGPGQKPLFAFSADGHRLFDLKINRPGIRSNGDRVPGTAIIETINAMPLPEPKK